MAIVVDINCLARVFNAENVEHAEFAPVLDYVMSGRGKLLFGGAGYMNELARAGRYRKLVAELAKAGKAARVTDAVVDQLEAQVRAKVNLDVCDDPHIIALLSASNCGLLCSDDARSYPFVHDRSLYQKDCVRVRIYRSRRNARILVRPSRRIWNTG